MTTYYLRNDDNETLIEADENGADFSVSVGISAVCNTVLSMVADLGVSSLNVGLFIMELDELSELRGEYFEATPRPTETMRQYIFRRFSEVAGNWNLYVVTD